jgi:gamma-glutamylcyclotransferase (GGCT)/AIG2-like uncharacterized protein YtfP
MAIPESARSRPTAESIQHLFAYGTQQPGLAPAEIAPVVARLRALGEGFLFGKLYDLGNYPGAVVDSASASIVYGTVFALPEDPGVIRALDAYEGEAFVRIAQLTTLVEGHVLDCWVYDYRGALGEGRLLESGRWTRRA